MAKVNKIEVVTQVGNVEVVKGIGKESGNEYTALRVVIGDWKSGLIFPRSRFEWQHISEQLGIDNPAGN